MVAATIAACVFGTPVFAQDAATPSTAIATRGKMLVAADGARIASISRVDSNGPQVIVDGRMVTVPAETISLTNGKVTTSLTKAQVIALP